MLVLRVLSIALISIAACGKTVGGAGTENAHPVASSPTPSPSLASSTPTTLAEAAFDAEVLRSPMPVLPGGATLGVVCCALVGIAGAPQHASVSVLLPAPDDAPGLSRPTIAFGQSFTIAVDKAEPEITSRPDFDAVRREAPVVAKDALVVYAAAHATLLKTDRYKSWPRPLAYTSILVKASQLQQPGQWTVYFHHLTAVNTVQVDVDLVAGVVARQSAQEK